MADTSDDYVLPGNAPAEPSSRRWAPAPKNEPNPDYVEPQGEPKKFDWADVGKSVAGQGALGATSDNLGLPGMVGEVADWAQNKAYQAGRGVAGMFGVDTTKMPDKSPTLGRTYEKLSGLPEGSLTTVPLTPVPVPTPAYVEHLVKKYGPDFLSYEPKTPEGQFAGSGARFGAQAATSGPVKGILGRTGAGIAAGLGSEGAGRVGQAVAGDPGETAGRLVGAVATPMALGHAFDVVRRASSGMAGTNAGEGLAKAFAKDWDNFSTQDRNDLLAAVQRGERINPVEVGGSAVTEYLRKIGIASPEARRAFADMNDVIMAKAQQSGSRLQADIANNYPFVGDPAQKQARMQAAADIQNKRVYDIARSEPAADAVWSPQLEGYTKEPLFQRYLKEADEAASNPRNNVKPRGTAAGVFAPDTPNLSYWDRVKQAMDDDINALLDQKQKTKASELIEAKRELVKHLDDIVPAYADARNTYFENKGATNAIQAGYETGVRGAKDAFESHDILKAFRKYSPEQQQLYREGMAAHLHELAGDPTAFVSFFRRNPHGVERARQILGASFDDLLINAQAKAVEAKFAALKPARETAQTGFHLPGQTQGQSAASLMAGAASSLGTAAAFGVHPTVAGMVGLSIPVMTSAVAWANNAAKTRAERLAAPHVVQMAVDPNMTPQLIEYARRNPGARSMLDKLVDHADELILNTARANTPGQAEQTRFARKAGGRIGALDHGGIAMSLIRAAEKAKKGHNTTTQPLLEQPDEAITKALAIADEALS